MNNSRKRKRRKKRPILVLVIAIVVIVAAIVVTHTSYFSVRGVAVIGNNDITDEEVIELSGVEIGKSIFDANPLIVKHRVKKNSYIESVKVSWEMPDKVQISITEKDSLAQFEKGKKFVVTDNEGNVVEIAKEERKATLVKGVKVKEAQQGETISVENEKALNKALELIALTFDNDLYFKEIDLSGSKVKVNIYDDLNCKGKYDDIVSSIESGTLKSVIYDLYQKGTEKGTINVYSNDYCFFTEE